MGGSAVGSARGNEVKKFQVGQVVGPVIWRVDDLVFFLGEGVILREIPRSLPKEVRELSMPMERTSVIQPGFLHMW